MTPKELEATRTAIDSECKFSVRHLHVKPLFEYVAGLEARVSGLLQERDLARAMEIEDAEENEDER